jgi:hypothetical protein
VATGRETSVTARRNADDELGGMNPPFPDFDPSRIIELDVRGILQGGGEPLPQILAAADRLPQGWVLHLRSPFQPVPLYGVMAEHAFRHHSTMFAGDDWSTWFWRASEEVTATRTAAAPVVPRTPAPADARDLRDLPPPEPLLAILAHVQDVGTPCRVVLPYAPTPLAALLEGHGWEVGPSEELPDGSVVVAIRPWEAGEQRTASSEQRR